MQASDVSGLVDRYGPEIYRYCRRLAGFAPDAEDLYQQTFLRLLELPQQLDEEQNPRALLYSVAGGIWKNEARKRGRRELPLEAIAAIEKLPVGTVKSRLHRAKQMLRQEMEAQGYERQKI